MSFLPYQIPATATEKGMSTGRSMPQPRFFSTGAITCRNENRGNGAKLLGAVLFAGFLVSATASYAARVTERSGEWNAVTWVGDGTDYSVHKTGNVSLSSGSESVTSLSMTSGGQLHVDGGTITSSGLLTVGGWGTQGYNANGALTIGNGGSITVNSTSGFSSIGVSGGTSTATINNRGTLMTNGIRVGNGGSSTATLNVNAGGTFSFRGELGIGIGSTGNLNVNGGSVTGTHQNTTIGGATGGINGTGTLNVASGSFSAGSVRVGMAAGTNGTLEMNGGTLTANSLSFGASGGTGSLKMDASATMVIAGDISVNTGTTWNLNVSGLAFGGSTGISAASLSGTGAIVSVDLTGFDESFLGTQYITLLTLSNEPTQGIKDILSFNIITGDNTGKYIDLAKLSSQSFVWDGNSLTLEVTTAIPESSTYATVIGLLVLGTLVARRKK